MGIQINIYDLGKKKMTIGKTDKRNRKIVDKRRFLTFEEIKALAQQSNAPHKPCGTDDSQQSEASTK